MLCVLLVAVVAAANAQADRTCVTEHCATEAEACLINGSTCKENMDCVSACLGRWDQDMTPEKFIIQNCTEKCTYSFTSETYVNFMTCLNANKCLQLPPLPNPCRRNFISINKTVPLSRLQGSWSAARGYNPVYDCYPCQKHTFDLATNTTVLYSALYKPFLADGGLGGAGTSGILKAIGSAQDGYSLKLDLAGMPSDETWWVIDAAEDSSYVLIYYCAQSLQWYSDGALVLAKIPLLSDNAITAITAAYKSAVGLDFAQFCKPGLTNCF